MIVALLNRQHGVGFAALRLGGRLVFELLKHSSVIEGDPRGDCFTAEPTIDNTPELRRRVRVIASQREFTFSDTLRDLVARECLHDRGDNP